MVMNFSMADLKAGRRFYDSCPEESNQPRKKLKDSLEATQCSSESGVENYKNTKPYYSGD